MYYKLVSYTYIKDTAFRPAPTSSRIMDFGTQKKMKAALEREIERVRDPREWVWRKTSYDRHGVCRYEQETYHKYERLSIEPL